MVTRRPGGTASADDWEVSIAQLDGRVSGIEASMQDIAQAVRNLSVKIEDRGRPQWQALGVGLSAVLAIGGLVYWPLAQGLDRFEKAQTRLSDTVVSKEDFLLITNAGKERRDDAQRTTDSRLARIEKDNDNTQSQIVPRGEIAEKWAGQRSINDNLQREIDEARSQLSSLYSPRDELTTLGKKVDDLERDLRDLRPH
jgi:hypothetical protein